MAEQRMLDKLKALEIHYEDKVDLIQIDEFAKRREDPRAFVE